MSAETIVELIAGTEMIYLQYALGASDSTRNVSVKEVRSWKPSDIRLIGTHSRGLHPRYMFQANDLYVYADVSESLNGYMWFSSDFEDIRKVAWDLEHSSQPPEVNPPKDWMPDHG
jgi:hypothetical protein